MKSPAPYFGNRFATVAKTAKKSTRKASEMEALEPRLLLSGITANSKVLKSYNFVDADGDKVSIKLTGKVANGAGFQVDGLGNGFDVNEINLVGNLTNNNLVINVKPVKLAPSDRTTANQLYTSGYTNIATISADSQATSSGTATGATAIRNIALNAAVVGDISLANTDITGAISLGIGKTAFVDRINTASPATGGQPSTYTPSVGFIDLYDVSAKSIGLISVNGSAAGTAPNNNIPGYTNTNDLLGSITVSGNVGGITAVRSNLDGTLDVTGNLGKVNVGGLNGTITAGGDITIVLPDGSDATISAGGHINVAWRGNTSTSSAELIAGKGISGLATSTTDALILGSNFDGSLTNSGAAFGISDIVVRGGVSDNFTAVSAGSIGNISAVGLAGVTIEAAGGNIGTITTTSGGVTGSITASGNVGAITVAGGELAATFVAGGSIGAVSANNIGDAISGSFVAGTSITSISATTLNGVAITGAAEFTAGTLIGAISATATANGSAIGNGADFNAGTTIAPITAQGSVGTATFDADGAITSITVTDGPLSAGDFAAAVTSGTSVGEVNIAGDFSGSISTVATGALTGGAIGAVTVGGEMSGDLTAAADTAANAKIGAILVGGGINGGLGLSVIEAGGAVESITVTSLGINAATMTNIGSITNALAVTGNLNSPVTTKVGGIGSISITADVDNAQDGDVTAAITSETSIGTISISGDLTENITAGTTIGAIVITGDLGDALADTINAQDGNIASLSVGGDLIGTVDVDNGAIAGSVGITGALNGKLLVENADNTLATIGDITIGEGIGSTGFTNIDAEGAVASITVSAGGIQVGGAAAISVGSITGAFSVTGFIDRAIETTVGGIGSITVLDDPAALTDPNVTAKITSVGDIGVIQIAGDLSSTIEATEGNINNVTLGSASGPASIIAGNDTVGTEFGGTIGNISITGDGIQSITLNAFSFDDGKGVITGGTIGNVSAIALADTKTLTLTVGANALSIGDITVDSPVTGETANLTLVNGVALVTIGDIEVDGNVDLDGGSNSTIETIGDVNIGGWLDIGATTLDSVTSLGDFTLNEFKAAVATIGAGIAGDATIGYVNITSNTNLDGGNMVTFEFETWTRVTGVTTLGNAGAFDIGLVDGSTILTGAGGVSGAGGQIENDITLEYI